MLRYTFWKYFFGGFKTNKKILAAVLFFSVILNSVCAAKDIYADMYKATLKYLNDGSQYSVYLFYPQKAATPFICHNQKWRSASMIKIFILAKAMEMVKEGSLSLDQNLTLHSSDKVGGSGILSGYDSGTQLSVRTLLKLMITESDNTATNMIIDLIGMQAINDYIQEKNYRDTILQRKMMDTAAISAGRENYSSVRDLGEIFTKIYNHECVSPEFDEIMIEFLLGQTDTECFNRALPNLKIAHKTGALAGSFDDGGIIYGAKSGDIILVIMTENFVGEKKVIKSMKKFARYVAKK